MSHLPGPRHDLAPILAALQDPADVLERPWGPVVLAGLGQNDEAFRRAVTAWLETPAGRVWLASRGTP